MRLLTNIENYSINSGITNSFLSPNGGRQDLYINSSSTHLMECNNCKTKLGEDCKFCPECGEKNEPLKIEEDIGAQVIEKLKNLHHNLEARAKDDKEKLYPCPHCRKEFTIEQLKSKNKEESDSKKSHPLNAQ